MPALLGCRCYPDWRYRPPVRQILARRDLLILSRPGLNHLMSQPGLEQTTSWPGFQRSGLHSPPTVYADGLVERGS